MTKITKDLEISGMHCAACSGRIENVVRKMTGVTFIQVNLSTEKARVTFQKDLTNTKAIINRIHQLGFTATLIRSLPHKKDQHMKSRALTLLKWKVFLSALLTFPLAWAMLAHFQWTSSVYIPTLFQLPYIQLLLAFPIQFILGYTFYEHAWKAVRNGSMNMDVLVVISTSAAFFYSHYLTITLPNDVGQPVLYFETSAFIITFILLGRYLEAKTKAKTTKALDQLNSLQTLRATIYKHGKEILVPIEQVTPGDMVVIKPGEKVPSDGQVIHGHALINEALLSGESAPVEKKRGQFIYAGTINEQGIVYINVTKNYNETALANIIQVVEDAQISKAPIQHVADRVTNVFVPIVMIIALASFTAWYVVFQPGNFHEALEKMIAVLIIACPCALGLATPTSAMVGSGRAAELGVLFKEGKYIELLSTCTTIIFDKTGTLTAGKPHVTNVLTTHINENNLLKLVGAVEQQENHPVADAITTYAKKYPGSLPMATEVFTIPGFGIEGIVQGKKVRIVRLDYFRQKNIPVPNSIQRTVKKLTMESKTVIVVQVDSLFAGVIAVTDTIKPTSATTIAQLKQMGYHILMLTGDNQQVGETVAKQLGIDYFKTNVSPTNKAAIIEQLQKENHRVTMVGDGMNDAPALTTADVGIALGTGADVTIESGDVTIMNGDIDRVIDVLLLSKKTFRNIKQNLLWAFLYNIIMIPFAILGFLAPWIAGAAMALSSVSVVLNALRLRNMSFKKNR